MPRCQAIATSTGGQCKKEASDGERYCNDHKDTVGNNIVKELSESDEDSSLGGEKDCRLGNVDRMTEPQIEFNQPLKVSLEEFREFRIRFDATRKVLVVITCAVFPIVIGIVGWLFITAHQQSSVLSSTTKTAEMNQDAIKKTNKSVAKDVEKLSHKIDRFAEVNQQLLDKIAENSEVPGSMYVLTIDGVSVTVRVAPDALLVRPKNEAVDLIQLADSVMRVQFGLKGRRAATSLEDLRHRYVVVPNARLQGAGIIVPRVTGIKDNELPQLLQADAGSCHPIFDINGGRAFLLGTITCSFSQRPSDELLKAITTALPLEVVAREVVLDNCHEVSFRIIKSGKNPFYPFVLSEALLAQGIVEYAEPDYGMQLRKFGSIPNDPLYHRQWYWNAVRLPEARELLGQQHRKPIIVAVIDDGVELQHEDLKHKLVSGYDFVTNDSDPSPDPSDGHGTAVAGLIGAATDNKKGIAGIANRCMIMPIRVAGSSGFTTTSRVQRSILYAQENGAKVICCCWGSPIPSGRIRSAIRVVTRKGCIVISACGSSVPAIGTFYPARFEECIAVGSVNRADRRFSYSCFGPGFAVDLVAPTGNLNLKGDIVTTDISGKNGYSKGGPDSFEPTGNYTNTFGGSSASTAIAVGIAALIWSEYPRLTAPQVRSILEKSAVKVDVASAGYDKSGGPFNGRSRLYGFGRVDALAAIKLAAKIANDE